MFFMYDSVENFIENRFFVQNWKKMFGRYAAKNIESFNNRTSLPSYVIAWKVVQIAIKLVTTRWRFLFLMQAIDDVG